MVPAFVVSQNNNNQTKYEQIDTLHRHRRGHGRALCRIHGLASVCRRPSRQRRLVQGRLQGRWQAWLQGPEQLQGQGRLQDEQVELTGSAKSSLPKRSLSDAAGRTPAAFFS